MLFCARVLLVCAITMAVAGCTPSEPQPGPETYNAEWTPSGTASEEGVPVKPEKETAQPLSSLPAESDEKELVSSEPIYWGIEEGEPLDLIWEDLMPEGSEEELIRQQDAFYAMLEKRYAANMTTLADADPYAAIPEGSEFDYMPQLGTYDTVDDLDGQLVRVPGYVVPLDLNSKKRLTEFLFVPHKGACIHTPPPAPNQIIFVEADPSVKVSDIWVPYWVVGTLATRKTENELGDTAYTMSLTALEPFPVP